ncbi:MAG: S8 family serine peptidase [Methanoregulaceae archaeon]|nr:S8 family serine peptidase [Methanoregulaceae archaeon]
MASAAIAQDDAFTMMLRMQEQSEREEAVALAVLYGIPVRQEFPDGTIMELMRFENGRPIVYITNNTNAALSTRANRVHPGGAAGLSLTGTGVTLGIWDGGGVRTGHQEFGGRVVVLDGSSNASHATHVGGTMIAAGVDTAAKGMSYQALLRSYNWTSDTSEMSTEANNGLRISNHSYGTVTGWTQNGSTWYWYGDRSHTEDANFGFYSSSARTWDLLAVNRPYYLAFKSAGNDRGDGPSNQPVTHKEWNGSAWIDATNIRPKDGGDTGYDTLPTTSNSKNMMIIGAVADVTNYTGPASVTMSSFSGWGPTDDGRIKPDIVANGVSLYSTTSSSNTAYGTSNGTSMSSPNAAGSAGLIVQHIRNRYSGQDFKNYALRGLILHTADECGPNPGPDYMFGWGLMNVEAACNLLTEDTSNGQAKKDSRVRVDTLGPSKPTMSRKFTYDGSGPIKVTICWTDPAGTSPGWAVDPPTPMLVRDLDVRVIGPTGTTHYPWVLNPASPASAATTGDNVRDNVEQVYIASPVAGDYTVVVSHKGSMPSTFEYALFTDNLNRKAGSLDKLTISPTAVTGGNNATGTVTLDGHAYYGNVTITLSDNGTAITTPPSTTVQFGQESSSFTLGTLAVATFWTGTVTATLDGITRSATLSVMPALGLQSLSMNRQIVIAGETSLTGLAVLTAFPSSPTTVTLSDSSPYITVPASVTIPAGIRYRTFAVTHTAVPSVQNGTVSATYNGVTKQATVTLSPPPVLQSLVVTPTTIKGGTSGNGTVNVSLAAPTGGIAVGLSTNTTAIILPPFVGVPQHTTSGSFTFSTVALPIVQVRTMSALYRGVVRSVTITITP